MKKNKLISAKLETLSATYSQQSDSNADGGVQFLEISTEDAGAGTYYVMKTERWAFDNINEIKDILQNFIERLDSIEKF